MATASIVNVSGRHHYLTGRWPLFANVVIEFPASL